MIDNFFGRNYKAFEEFKLEFRALTILLGSNSTGKSAVVNSLLMLSQSADTNIQSESALRLNGAKVGMGEALNIITEKDPDRDLSYGFTLSPKSELAEAYRYFQKSSLEGYMYLFNHLALMMKDHKQSRAETQTIKDMLKFSPHNPKSKNIDHGKFRETALKVLKYFRTKGNAEKLDNLFSTEIRSFILEAPLTKVKDGIDEVLAINSDEICPTKFLFTFEYEKRDKHLAIKEYIQWNESGKVILKISKNKEKKITISSEIYSNHTLSRSKQDISKKLNLNSLNIVDDSVSYSLDAWSFTFFKNSTNPFAGLILSTICLSTSRLLGEISTKQINHVSPLRALPQRYYLLDKTIHHKQLNALEGTELAEVLKNSPKILKSVNLLFAKHNIAIDIEKVNDIIHKIVVTQDSVRLELTDVGFGISQVLPILVQAHLSPPDSLTIIEQPEIHLHPNMQAWLADALINIALEQNKKFLIETHSDALIRRLRLRILDDKSSLTEEDVKIYHLHRTEKKNRSKLEEIPITGDGDIRWPLGFMDAEINDTVEIQRLRTVKIANKLNSQLKGSFNG